MLGNGDIWEASDAIRMVETTGAAGVVVGRGCLGRPWIFRDLAAAFAGEQIATLPTLGEVAAMRAGTPSFLAQHMGEERACKEFRKHVSWYLKGFRAGGDLRRELALVETLAGLTVCRAARPHGAVPGVRAGVSSGPAGEPAPGRPAGRLASRSGRCGSARDRGPRVRVRRLTLTA